MKQYAVTLHSPRDIFFSTYTLAGLHELRYRGIIDLDYRFTDFEGYHAIPEIIDYTSRDSWDLRSRLDGLARYTVKHLASGRVVRMGVDLNDAADMFSQAFLDRCDIVFKRHYQTRYIQKLNPASQVKLHPGGLSYGVRSVHEQGERSFYLFYLAKIAYDLTHIRYLQATSRSRLRAYVLEPLGEIPRSIRRHRQMRTIPEYEQDCHAPSQSSKTILFQTRCWMPQGNRKTDKQRLNEERAGLIRKLRAAFGDRFIGGFIPDEFSRQQYPDCLTSAPTSPREYTELVKNAAVVISTQGVINSPPWKLAEYLASAKCIVSEALLTELPRPLVHGEDIIFFTSHEDCLEQCARLLDNPALIEKLSCNAQAYYRAEVEPSTRVLQMLEKAASL